MTVPGPPVAIVVGVRPSGKCLNPSKGHECSGRWHFGDLPQPHRTAGALSTHSVGRLHQRTTKANCGCCATSGPYLNGWIVAPFKGACALDWDWEQLPLDPSNTAHSRLFLRLCRADIVHQLRRLAAHSARAHGPSQYFTFVCLKCW